MIPLIKIRATYLKRNKFKVFVFYLFIPLIILIAVLTYVSDKDSEEKLEFNEKQKFEYQFGSNYYLFRDSNFNNISIFLKNTSLVVNDKNIGNKLVEYIKDKVNLDLELYSEENQLNNHSQNIVILDYNKKTSSYKFTYKEKEIVEYNTSNTFPFMTTQLSSEISSDVFNYKYDDKNYYLTDIHNKRFLIYQAFFAKFLIEKIKGGEIKKDIHFNLGLNSYPKAVKNPRDYSIIEPMPGYLITMQFTFIFLCFSIQMLEEKEQKLEKLLERQGINQIKYLLSWFFNFLIVSIFTNAACIFGGYQLLQTFMGLYILDLILFNLSTFSLMLLIVTISKNKKIGIILVSLISFGSLVLGYILTIGFAPPAIQVIFNFLPNANIFSSIKLIIKLQFIGRYSFENILLNYNKINYLDTLIMFIVDIILYINQCLLRSKEKLI